MSGADRQEQTGATASRFSYARIWALGVGFLGIQLAFAVYNAFLPLLYREFVDSRALVGLLMGTDNLVGLLMIPLVGAWSDRVRSPLGRRLPFVVVAIPVAALTLVAIPYAAVALWALIVVEVVFTAAMHAYRGPMASLIVDHTPPRRRSTSSGIAQLLGGVGVLVSFLGLARLYDRDPRLPFAGAAAVLLVSLAVVWWRAERFPPHVDNTTVSTRPPLRDTVDGLRGLLLPQRRGRLLVFGAMLAAYVAFAGLQAMFPIYGVESLGLSEGDAAFLLAWFAAAMLLASLVAGLLGTRLGPVPAITLGLTALPIVYLAATWVRDPDGIAMVLAVAGLLWPLFAVPAVALAADLGGVDRIGFHLGLYYLFTMAGQMVGPFVLGSAMDVFGNQGMWPAAAAVTVGALVLLRLGARRLARDARVDLEVPSRP